MEAFRQYLRDLFTGWQGIMSGTASIVFLVIGFIFKLADLGQLRYWLVASFVCFIVAAYLAWHRQYRENRIGREIGSIAFDGLLLSGFQRQGRTGHVQLTVSISNLHARLARYTIKDYRCVLGGQECVPEQALQHPINHEAFIYPLRPSQFLLRPVENVPMNDNPVLGTLDYSVTYQYHGSHREHHSTKSLRLYLHHNVVNIQETTLRWTVSNETED
jgi:hypothetical protein